MKNKLSAMFAVMVGLVGMPGCIDKEPPTFSREVVQSLLHDFDSWDTSPHDGLLSKQELESAAARKDITVAEAEALDRIVENFDLYGHVVGTTMSGGGYTPASEVNCYAVGKIDIVKLAAHSISKATSAPHNSQRQISPRPDPKAVTTRSAALFALLRFSSIDTDTDGVLSEAELSGASDKLPVSTKWKLNLLISNIDTIGHRIGSVYVISRDDLQRVANGLGSDNHQPAPSTANDVRGQRSF